MRKFLKNTVIIVAAATAVVLQIMLYRYLYIQLFFAEPTVIQTSVSPDGEYTAYVFESNSGATTGWVYHITVLPSGKALGKGNENVYTSRDLPEYVKWIYDDELYVYDYKTPYTTYQKKKIYNIKIRYHSSEYEPDSGKKRS